ncbi:hypothetical protein PJL18_03023 [Paenarthrobacter nicotinovorans]|nr:hypothetical protein [Paenarthrobacter nicotinovorans]
MQSASPASVSGARTSNPAGFMVSEITTWATPRRASSVTVSSSVFASGKYPMMTPSAPPDIMNFRQSSPKRITG